MPKKYPEHIKDEALGAVAVLGSAEQAAKKVDVPARTILNWLDTDHERFQRIADELAPKLRARSIVKLNAVVDQAADGASEALDAASRSIAEGNAKDAAAYSSAARNAATVLGIANQNAQLKQGLPTEIHGSLSADDVIKNLANLMGIPSIDGTAEEVESRPLLADSGGPNAREDTSSASS